MPPTECMLFSFLSVDHTQNVLNFMCVFRLGGCTVLCGGARSLCFPLFLEGVCEGESGCFLIFEPTVAVMEVHGGS